MNSKIVIRLAVSIVLSAVIGIFMTVYSPWIFLLLMFQLWLCGLWVSKTIAKEDLPETRMEKFKAMFPLKGHVTAHILQTAKLADPRHCVGAMTLREALGVQYTYLPIMWVNMRGWVTFDNRTIPICTKEDIRMIDVKEPTTVTFVLTL